MQAGEGIEGEREREETERGRRERWDVGRDGWGWSRGLGVGLRLGGATASLRAGETEYRTAYTVHVKLDVLVMVSCFSCAALSVCTAYYRNLSVACVDPGRVRAWSWVETLDVECT